MSTAKIPQFTHTCNTCRVCGEYSPAIICRDCAREVARATKAMLPWRLKKGVA